jgi:hypothetical protein
MGWRMLSGSRPYAIDPIHNESNRSNVGTRNAPVPFRSDIIENNDPSGRRGRARGGIMMPAAADFINEFDAQHRFGDDPIPGLA